MSAAAPARHATLESLLRRDRLWVAAGMAGLTGLGWTYLFYDASASHCARMAEMAMPHMQSWGVKEFSLMFAMWSIMMVAMMVPSAAPMILMFSTLNRKRRLEQRPYTATGLFVAGYLAIWTLFSFGATVTQFGLHAAALLSPAMVSTSPILSGGLLMAAGVFQLTPLKRACLQHCRSPFHFILSGWREGRWGAFSMGLHHGAYCVGCCWVLMALLFAAGVMNLAWVAAISVFVLVEKLAPAPKVMSMVSGAALVAAGVWMLFGRAAV